MRPLAASTPVHRPPRHRDRRTPAAGTVLLLLIIALACGTGCEPGGSRYGITQPSQELPVVVGIDAPAAVPAGDTVFFSTHVFAAHAVRGVDIEYRRAVAATVSYEFQPARLDTVEVAAFLPLPVVPADTILEVRVAARDTLGRTGAIMSRSVRILPAAAGGARD